MAKNFLDPELSKAVLGEEERQKHNIELVASENFVSKAVRQAQGSVLTNKYSEGYPGKRYYGGNEYIDIAENLAIERAKELFGISYANVQPHSGSTANFEAYMAFLHPGDKILGMNLDSGGHLTHGASVSFSGKLYQAESYKVNPETELLDYDTILKQAKEFQPKLIIAGASAYSRTIDFQAFRDIADEVGAYLMVDIAHIAGLIAAGLHPSPVGLADVITTTTHKTLRGPRGGMILADEKYARKINSAVFPGSQGGPLDHVVAAKAAAFYEDLQPEFKTYSAQIIKNAKAMADAFSKEDDIRVVSGGTDNHMFTLDLTKTGLTGKKAQELLDSVSITLNREALPNEKLSPFVTSGVRIGTPAMTTKGMKEADMLQIEQFIMRAIHHAGDTAALAQIKQEVFDFMDKFPFDSDPF
ncbi:serine hydroxymethyltransferase [Oenococcus kitaharae]|uniref:Serine hydroxymethyltransferase n=1 Tax=Oenococcus kitaharae DSM 17330 TaxID=1045004 RepID=G9WGD3_9LACO|nr:serine hydroxymethyltransferase [Oenococcus kitaharae]EHN59741.1 Serine hydroxymethyltransferase [Oenococcus kitaharae DSM 17330]OEY83569.1 serine hydroxymethyltransferase [Oenococcus kitaharae]OEY85367.1 serine hydroxymethyltransferase [Oenococcus kitaharae]OEY86220.1 serine hydroxymethyltransferase [Oenococcus kitaharae]